MRFRKDIIKPPEFQNAEDVDSERHAEWLELLYDLVFVAAISIVTLNLSSDYTFKSFFQSIPIFFVIWWGWVGHTFYLSRFGTNDLFHRVLTLIQMLGVASLAVSAEDAWGSTGVSFALSYAFLRIMLLAEYIRVAKHIEEARPLSRHYCIGWGITAIIWIASAFVPAPWRFILWGVAIILDLITPITAANLHVNLPPHSTHLPERFGLFTIIIIGEAVVSVVFKITNLGLNLFTEITGIMGIVISFCIWWSYFEEAKGAETKVMKSGNMLGQYQLWLYSHFPLILGVVTLAAGIKNVIALNSLQIFPNEAVWLLCASLALTFSSLSLIFMSSFTLKECQNQVLQFFRLPYYIIIILILLTGFLGNYLPGAIILGILTSLCILKVILSLREPPAEAICNL